MTANDRSPEVDTANRQLVGMRGDKITVMAPMPIMTKDQALVQAAYLVSMVCDDERWKEVLHAVQNT